MDVEEIKKRFIEGDRRALARLISLRLQRRDASQERLECTAILGS